MAGWPGGLKESMTKASLLSSANKIEAPAAPSLELQTAKG
jgi:hypothetical protein